MTATTTKTRTSLGGLLIEQGIINQQQLDEALAAQGALGLPLGETLIRLGMVTPSQVFPVLQSQMNVPWADLSEGLVDPRVVPMIPRDKAERYGVLALFRVRETLTVAMSDPRAIFVIDELENLTGLRLLPVLVSQTDLRKATERCYAETAFHEEVDVDDGPDPTTRDATTQQAGVEITEKRSDESPVVTLVNAILSKAVGDRASDVHIEPGRDTLSVRFRIDGELYEVMTPKLGLHAALISRLKVMTKMDIAEHRRPQDGRTMVMVDGREIDIRASCMPTTRGEKMALRLLDRESVRFDLNEMGMGRQMRSQIDDILASPSGMILVTGPTGSGKTTTLYCLLSMIRGVERNVVSVEDPVEYDFDYVNQVQVNESIGLGFASILRTFLRQDPDYIMVGEIRDLDTAKMAVQAALTGHLVLSTLHTNDSVATIARLVNIGVDPMMLSAGIKAIIAQRLVRTNCPKCTEIESPSDEYLKSWGLDPSSEYQFSRGKGCSHCFGTGLRGRVAIYEVLTLTDELRHAIGERAGVEQLRKLARECGMSNLYGEGVSLVAAGRTTMDEVLSVVDVEQSRSGKRGEHDGD